MKILNRKGQSAIEFLMTYGWAFMVAFGFMGALFYFGVLDFGNLLPDKCEFASEFECEAYLVTEATGMVESDGEILFKMVNNLGVNIVIDECSLMLSGIADNYEICLDSHGTGIDNFGNVDPVNPTDADLEVFNCGSGVSPLVNTDVIKAGSTWKSGQSKSFFFKGCSLEEFGLVANTKQEFLFRFTYHATQSSYPHNVTGRIFTTISKRN